MYVSPLNSVASGINYVNFIVFQLKMNNNKQFQTFVGILKCS